MAATALDDARRFLDLHPWCTTDVDNPVDLLRALVDEGDVEEEDEDEGMQPDADDEAETSKAVKLLTFIKGLRDDLKISEAEYQFAVSLSK